MTLSQLADIATIIASLLAVLGVGWLVFVQIRRHRRVKEDYGNLCEQMQRSVESQWKQVDQSIAEAKRLPESPSIERIELFIRVLGRQLADISSDLMILQLIALASFLRQHDADEEVAALLADWKLRSPITRRK